MSVRRRHRQSDYIDHFVSVPPVLVLALAQARTQEPGRPHGRHHRRTGPTTHRATPGGPTTFFIIVSGEAEVSRNGQVVAKLTDRDYFGELALLDPARRNATVTARTAIKLIVLSQWDFEEALNEAPGMTRRLLAGMARRLRELDGET